MILNQRVKDAYHRHSIHQNRKDGKERVYYFEIENLESDYEEMKQLLQAYLPLRFDFVSSCLYSCPPNVRFFSKTFTGRFSVNSKVSLAELQQNLIKDGYSFVSKEQKSGPLCLNADFTEPLSAKIFKLTLPVLETKLWLYRTFPKLGSRN
jgi:hypothetical protein